MQRVTFVGVLMLTVITSRSDGEETSEEGIIYSNKDTIF